MAIEVVGFRAEIQNLQAYITGAKQIQDANNKIALAQRNVEEVTTRSAIKQQAANTAVVRSQIKVAETQEANARIITNAVRRVDLAQARVSESATKSAAVQAKANVALDSALIALSDKRAVAATRLADVQDKLADNTRKASQLTVFGDLDIIKSKEKLALAMGRSNVQVSLMSRLLSPFRAAQRAAADTTSFFGKALLAITGFSNRFAVALKFGVAALTAFTAAMTIGVAANFESSLAKIDVLTEASAKDTAFLSKEILNLAKTVPKSPDELGAAAYVILSSGVKNVQEGFDILERSAVGASAGLGNVQDVARTVTGVINAYGKENITAKDTVDILFAAIQQGSAEASDFANNIARTTSIAKTLGIEFDELAAGVAVLTNSGLGAAQSTTALLGVLNQLISPSQEAKDALKTYGTSIEEIRKNIREDGLISAMEQLNTKLGNNIQAFELIFPEVRGLGGALTLFSAQSGRAAEVLDTIRRSAGITDAAFERMSKTFNFQVGLLKNQLNIALIQLGSAVLPSLTKAVRATIGWFERNREAIIKLVKTIAVDIVKAVDVFVTGLKTINSALSFIPTHQGIIIAAVAAIGLAMVLAFGPVLPIITAIVFGLGAIAKLSPSVKLSVSDIDKAGGVEAALRAKGVPDFAIKEAVASVEGGVPEARAASEAAALVKEQEAEATRKAEEAAAEYNLILKQLASTFTDKEIPATEEGLTVAEALADGIIDFAEAAKLGINAIQAGALEASVMFREADEKAFNFTKTLSKVANAFERSRAAAEGLVLALAREALAKTQAAAQAIFGRPTREVAELELSLAQIQQRRLQAEQSIVPQIQALQDQLEKLPKDVGASGIDNAFKQQGVDLFTLGGGIIEAARLENEKATKQITEQAETIGDSQRDAIQNQIEALENQLQVYDRETESVQRNIDIYRIQSEILQKQIELADATLLTQEEQKQKALELIEATATQSQAVRDLATSLNQDVIPEMNEMRDASKLVNEALSILNDPTIRALFIPAVEEASTQVRRAATASQELGTQAFYAAEAVVEFADELQNVEDFLKMLGNSAIAGPRAVPAPANPFTDPANMIPGRNPFADALRDLEGFQQGGFVGRNQIARLHAPEVVLPLRDANRSRELLRAIPSSMMEGIFKTRQSGGTPNSVFGDINIQGNTLEDMRATAHAAVDSAFAKARVSRHAKGLPIG